MNQILGQGGGPAEFEFHATLIGAALALFLHDRGLVLHAHANLATHPKQGSADDRSQIIDKFIGHCFGLVKCRPGFGEDPEIFLNQSLAQPLPHLDRVLPVVRGGLLIHQLFRLAESHLDRLLPLLCLKEGIDGEPDRHSPCEKEHQKDQIGFQPQNNTSYPTSPTFGPDKGLRYFMQRRNVPSGVEYPHLKNFSGIDENSAISQVQHADSSLRITR